MNTSVESSWNVMAHGDAQERKWRGNWRMVWVASTLHTTSEHGVSRIITADAWNSAASSRLNWRPRRFKWTRQFRRKTKSGFCACAITFQLASSIVRNNSLPGTREMLLVNITLRPLYPWKHPVPHCTGTSVSLGAILDGTRNISPRRDSINGSSDCVIPVALIYCATRKLL